MARVLIVGGGCRGRALARALSADGHGVRITTRSEAGRSAIEDVGAECWVGTPHAVGTLRYALENVTVLCWLLATVGGNEASALHGSRLEMMLSKTLDTTVRGVAYEAVGTVDRRLLQAGAAIVRGAGERSGIPVALIEADQANPGAWLVCARNAIDALLKGPGASGLRPGGAPRGPV